MRVRIKKLHPDAVIPKYAKEGDACFDLTAIAIEFFPKSGEFTSKPEEYAPLYFEYKTGLAIEIPEGYFGLIRPRSSISKTALIFNTSGIIDSGYRGELTVRFKCSNLRTGKVYEKGDRVAQLMILPYPHVIWEETNILSETERGTGGYGSTGK